MGETFQLYLKSECTGLIFCAIDLNPRKIMRLKKIIFSRLSLYNHWVILLRTRVADFIKYIVDLIT